jgi:Kef-type K+ transport system membrane component KefB
METIALDPVVTLLPAVTLLLAGILAALACRAVKLSPIVGYLVAGVLIGPQVFGLIEESPTARVLAELGVVFLLFDIGLHFSLRDIPKRRDDMLRLAPLHLVLTGLPFVLIAMAMGASLTGAVLIGGGMALSSTAVVARLMNDRAIGGCPLGRSSMAVLVFQDIVGIFLLILAASIAPEPAAGAENSQAESMGLAATLGLALVKAIIAGGLAALAGRYLMRPLFRVLAATQNEDVFTVTALLVVLAAAAAAGYAELSMTLGGFLAGMAISDTPYRHVIQTEAKPFRSLLLGFFFMTVGMSLDLSVLVSSAPLILALTVALLVLKTLGGYLAARLAGWSMPGATQFSFLLGQGSEFTLVLLAAPGLIASTPEGTGAIWTIAIALSLALAPQWAGLGMMLARKRAEMAPRPGPETAAGAAKPPVVVFGMSEPGRLAVDALLDHGFPVVAIEVDPARFVRALADGYEVAFGDAADFRLIETLGASNARAVVLGVSRYDISQAVSADLAERFPNLVRFVAAISREDASRHAALGMLAFAPGGTPEGIELVAALLAELGVSEDARGLWIADRLRLETSAAA